MANPVNGLMYVTSSFFIPFRGDWHIQRQVLSQVMTLEVTFRNPEMRGVGSFWKDVSESQWNKFLGPGTKVSYQCKYTSLVIYLRLSPSDPSRYGDNGHCSGLQSTWRCEAMQKIHLNKVNGILELGVLWFVLFIYGCFRKWWYPQIIHFDRVFHYNPFWVYPYFWKHPYWWYCSVFQPLTIYELGLDAFIEPFLTNPKIR